MAKKAAAKVGGKSKARKKAVAKVKGLERSRDRGGSLDMGEAFVKLLQSPLVAELVAVAATAALASLAEHGFSHRGRGGGTTGNRAGRAVKEAGKAAAAAVGRRLGTEVDEIRKASTASKPGAKA
jgi:hypothetical protein